MKGFVNTGCKISVKTTHRERFFRVYGDRRIKETRIASCPFIDFPSFSADRY